MKKNYSNLKFYALSLVSLMAINANSVNYYISFTGTGASTSVGNVIVENTTQKTIVTVPAGNILNLTNTVTSVNTVSSDKSELTCKTDKQGISTFSFNAKQAGLVHVNVFSVDGRKMTGSSNQLAAGICNYSLALPKGIYVLKVTGSTFSYTSKLNIETSINSNAALSFLGTEAVNYSEAFKSKTVAHAITQMLYNAGDQLVFKGNSDIYTTYVPSIPTGDAVVNFNFIDCTDADGNHYATVTIGGQIWMAENLKTTKYSDNSVIPFGVPTDLGTPNAYYANGDASTKDALGLLYKWSTTDAASNGNKDVSPAGWHVPTYTEMNTLLTQVGTGAQNWTKLRTNDASWNVTDGTNATGFSAKCAGFYWGAGNPKGTESWFWTSSKWLGGPGNSFLMFLKTSSLTGSIDASDNVAVSASIRCIHN